MAFFLLFSYVGTVVIMSAFMALLAKAGVFPELQQQLRKQGLKENLGTGEHFHAIIPLKLEDVKAAFI